MAITNLIYVYATKDNNEHAHSILTMKGATSVECNGYEL